MAIEGPLRELGLSELFQMLDFSGKTGTLTVRGESRPHPALVHFDRGGVVGAELPGTLGRLGHILMRAGKITEAQMEAALREQQSGPRRPYGAILVEKGWGSAEDVQHYLRFQVEETIFELVRWTEGYFRFEEEFAVHGDSVPIRLSIQSLLMEAARRIDEWTTIETAVPHMTVVPVLVVGEAAGRGNVELDLRPAEWEVLGEINGEHTLKQIADELASSDFAVAKTIFGLISAGVVEIARGPVPAHPVAAIGGPAPGRIGEIEEVLRAGELRQAQREACEMLVRATQQDPLSAPAYYHLGFAAARTGDLSRAEEAWTIYLRLPDAAAHRRNTATRAAAAAGELRKILTRGAV